MNRNDKLQGIKSIQPSRMPKWIYWSPWARHTWPCLLCAFISKVPSNSILSMAATTQNRLRNTKSYNTQTLECLKKDLENSYIYKMIRVIDTMSGFAKFVGFCFQSKGITLWTYFGTVPGSRKASLKENLDTSYFTSKQKHRSDSSSPWQNNSSENHHWTKFLSVGFEMYWGLAEMASRLEHVPENWGSALSTHCRWLTRVSSFHLYTPKRSKIWRQTTSEYKPWQ